MSRFEKMVAGNKAIFEYCERIRQMNQQEEKPNGFV
ncbi:hypothetical protein AH6C_067 [Aeromonas phage pAh6-C]|uniref:Uncharacterized protein n=1 Tax=Aeromonas phage pAh6-C TaxID=1505227 RepID=A0A076G3R4_9CAUD|nr:hypothetical protein AH6C_067 [Aeromonas phage pAh6-C]AII26821.1 hypothetical protein AH6C_067 [Aeromonas phage pAh6-C]